MKQILLMIVLFGVAQTLRSQTSYTWNGSVSTAWNTPANWTPNGVPGASDNITIVTGANTCVLNSAAGIANITLTSGTLDLGGFTLTAAGTTAQFTAGTIQNGALTVSGANSTVFGNGPVTMNCLVNITSAAVTMKNTTFQNTTNITKTGASNDASSGNNVFNGAVTFINAGAGYLMSGNGSADLYNAAATFTNTGSSQIYVGFNSNNNTFNGPTTFNNSPVANTAMYISWYSGGTIFNDNIVVNSINGQGIQFCGGNTTATATLAATKTISVGAGGFSAGTLSLRQFSQVGATAQNLLLTGTGILTYGPSSSFGGDITSSSPSLYFNGCIFNGATSCTKTGPTGDWSTGGNTFNGVCNLTNSGSSYLLMGNSSPDIWNNDVTFTDNGSERLLPCWATAGNQFNGNIYVNTSGSATGIQFCGGNTTATATLAATKTIMAGATGLTAGYLYLKQFTQAGNTPVNLTGTGTSTLYLGPSSNFGGAVTATYPDIWAQGATYNSAVVFTKTGGSSNHNNQYQNIFNSTCTINQQSNTGYFMLGYNSNDLFNDNITLTSTGTGGINLGWSSGTGTPALAAGKTILVGAAGFSAGYLNLNTFTQLGNAPLNLSFTGTNTALTFARNTVIGGDLTASGPDIFLNGAAFNGASAFTKTGSNGDWSNGGNTFSGVCSITNSGSNFWVMGNSSPDIWNNDVTFTDNGSERLLPCWATAGNQFNGNISVNTSGSATGIQFCGGNATASATLAATKTIQAGAGGLNAGYLILKQFTQLGNAAVNLTMAGSATYLQFGPASAIGGDMTSSSPGLYFSGCTFSGIVNAVKTGASNDNSSGNNIFNGVTTITDNGGQLLLGNINPDQFNTDATFTNAGSGNFYVAYNSVNNVFGGVTTFNNSPTGNNLIYVTPYSAGTVFSGNIVVSSTNGQGVQFCGGNTTATATLAATRTIGIGPGGFSAGTLLLKQFTQVGATAQNFLLTGTGILTYGPGSLFGGDITSSSPALFFNGGTFNGTTNFTKTGPSGDYSQGGNIFNGITSITNSGSSYLLLGNNNPDTWNNDVTFTDNGSERLLPCWATAGNQFNGNIFVNTSGSATGIQFCGGTASATATLAATKTIQAGAGGLNAGYLILKQFTQLGNAAVNLTMNSPATYLQFGPGSALGGDITSSSPGLYFNGCVFSGVVNAVKTGATNDNSSGNNIFNGVTTMTDAGAGYLLFGNGNRDQFNAAATFSNTGSSNIYVAYNSSNNIFGGVTTFSNTPTANTLIYVSQNSAGTLFNDNIVVTSTNGQGVQFCGSASATATLAATKTITVGPGGFSSGTLLLRQFTQTGATPQNLALTGTGNLTFGPSSAFGGDVTSTSPTLFFSGCNFGGMVTSVKNGSTSDASPGNNVFNGPFTITNSGAGYFLMGNGSPDLWRSTAVFNNFSSAQHMYAAYNSTGNIFGGDVTFNNQPGSAGLWIYPDYYGINTQFNGNITVTNLNGGGVYFGAGTGTSILASGYSLSTGAGGFNSGGLVLKNFTQTGAGTPQNITTTGTSYLQYGASASFDAPVTSSSPGLFFNGATFNGTVNSTKTGATNDQSQGNNIFNGVSTFTNSGTGYLLMTSSTPDAYNGNVSFVQNGAGLIYPNYNGNSTYSGNLSVTSPAATAITFGANTGTATFTGATGQAINATGGTPTPIFTRLVIANTGAGVTLNTTSVNVSKSLVLTSGLLNTTTTYILTMLNGSVTAAGTALSTSYVNGPMRYQKSSAGATTLNFPIGTSPDCRPVVLTVNHTTGNLYTYTAQLYNASAYGLLYTLPPSVTNVSHEHYYTIGRTNAAGVTQPTLELSGNQTIQIFFGANDFVSNGATLTVVKNTYLTPTKWIDIGGMGGPAYSGGASLTGSITSTSSPTAFNSFSTFAIADEIGGSNVLPIGLLYFNATADNDKTDLTWATSAESNNAWFTVERSRDGVKFSPVLKVASEAPDGNSSTTLDYTAQDPSPYTGLNYYRLRQTDLDGKEKYSRVVSVNFDRKQNISTYPNPTTGTLFVSGLGQNQNSLQAEWFDLSGRSLLQQTVPVQNGVARLNARFNNGVYLLKFVASDGTVKLVNVILLK